MPRDGDSVPVGVRVEGESSGITPGQVPDTEPPWIYVLVRPIPGDPNQSWFVQPFPLIEEGGSWDAFVFVGLETDPSGTPFDICAIVSDEELVVGRYGGEPPPALSRDCISVTRYRRTTIEPMSILIDENTSFIIQGITGREAVNMTRECLDYGSKIVGGVTPGRGGRDVEKIST